MNPGFLVIDKPAGITSHDVVAMVRAVTGVRKVGHTGTLDPFATGVLPLALGPATRLIQYLDENLKVYEARIALGAATDTGDPTGTVITEVPIPELDDDAVNAVLAGFKGIRQQEPPRHSAVKVAGRPLYAYAREGRDVRAKPRPIRIDGVTLRARSAEWMDVCIECGRGTYARALADEIAVELGTRGHLSALRRTRSGPFADPNTLSMEALSMIVTGRPDWQVALRPTRGGERVQWKPRAEVHAALSAHLISPLAALGHLPVRAITAPQAGQISRGGRPPPPAAGTDAGAQYLLADRDRLVAVARHQQPISKVLRVVARQR